MRRASSAALIAMILIAGGVRTGIGARRSGVSLRVDAVTDMVLGRADAPLTMVEFSDLQCVFCREYALLTFDSLKKAWIDTGRLRYVSRDFPLASHDQAMAAARAARCAGEQGRSWDMRLELMRNATAVSADSIANAAVRLNLDVAAFSVCSHSSKFDELIRSDQLSGLNAGVRGTPTFVVGRTTADGVEGSLLVGATTYAQLNEALKALVGGA